jgi:hypothetical protein
MIAPAELIAKPARSAHSLADVQARREAILRIKPEMAECFEMLSQPEAAESNELEFL